MTEEDVKTVAVYMENLNQHPHCSHGNYDLLKQCAAVSFHLSNLSNMPQKRTNEIYLGTSLFIVTFSILIRTMTLARFRSCVFVSPSFIEMPIY